MTLFPGSAASLFRQSAQDIVGNLRCREKALHAKNRHPQSRHKLPSQPYPAHQYPGHRRSRISILATNRNRRHFINRRYPAGPRRTASSSGRTSLLAQAFMAEEFLIRKPARDCRMHLRRRCKVCLLFTSRMWSSRSACRNAIGLIRTGDTRNLRQPHSRVRLSLLHRQPRLRHCPDFPAGGL